ncbi:MAG: hypothetical protein KQH57_07310 [Actinomycetales bacterium]|nr:hypothetical protein [Actinomycetales bacterium]
MTGAGNATQTLDVDGRRPAVARVASLPREYRLTDAEWRVLMVLACDSYDGETAAPGMDNLVAWTGKARSSVAAAMAHLTVSTEHRPALLERAIASQGRNRTEWRLILPEPSASDRTVAIPLNRPATVRQPSASDRTVNRPATVRSGPDTPSSPEDPFPPAARPAPGGGAQHDPHQHEPNARAALERLAAERALPVSVDELLEAAYRLGSGDPWEGYRDHVKPATEGSLDGTRDPGAVLRARLGIRRAQNFVRSAS